MDFIDEKIHIFMPISLKLFGRLFIDSNTPYYITFCGLEHTSKNVLMHAAAYGDVEILKLLLTKGAKLNEVDDLGFNALDFALAAGKKENAAYLQSLGLKANKNLFYRGSLE